MTVNEPVTGRYFCNKHIKSFSVSLLHVLITLLTLRRRIKSHLLFAGIIRSSPFSPR